MRVEQLTSLSKRELEALQKVLPTMTVKEKMDLFEMLEEREKRLSNVLGRSDMIEFAKYVYPGFKVGAHHRKLAKIFTDVVEGKKKRVIINIAPRMGKSEFSSYLFPAYFMGRFPEKKIIMGTHTASLGHVGGLRPEGVGQMVHPVRGPVLCGGCGRCAGRPWCRPLRD